MILLIQCGYYTVTVQLVILNLVNRKEATFIVLDVVQMYSRHITWIFVFSITCPCLTDNNWCLLDCLGRKRSLTKAHKPFQNLNKQELVQDLKESMMGKKE